MLAKISFWGQVGYNIYSFQSDLCPNNQDYFFKSSLSKPELCRATKKF